MIENIKKIVVINKLNSTTISDDNDNEFDRVEVWLRMLLRVSAAQKNEVLVLSAWGCGAFGCTPEGVAKIFRHI